MKILKRIVIVLVVLVAVYLIVGLIMPGDCHVERTTMIKANAITTFDEINNLKHWKSWSYWDNIDPNMKSTYEGPESGVGAKHLWESTSDSVGKGSLTITKSEPGKLIEAELAFEGMGSSMSGWKIRDTTDGVLVTTYMDMEMPFYMRPMMLFMDMDAMLGGDFEKSLAGLKKHVESLSSPEMVAITIEATTMAPMKIMIINDSADLKTIGEKLGGAYGEIMGEMGKQGLTQNGSVFAIYNKVDMNRPDGGMYFWMDIGVPVDKAGKSSGRITYKEVPGGNVVKGSHYGAYEKTGESHEQMDKWMKENGKVVTGGPWEFYVTDPGAEPDTSKWLTEIYYPVQ